MTLDQLRSETRLTLSVDEAGSACGIGRTLARDLARRGAFPVRVLRIGRRVVVPTADLQRFLGVKPVVKETS